MGLDITLYKTKKQYLSGTICDFDDIKKNCVFLYNFRKNLKVFNILKQLGGTNESIICLKESEILLFTKDNIGEFYSDKEYNDFINLIKKSNRKNNIIATISY